MKGKNKVIGKGKQAFTKKEALENYMNDPGIQNAANNLDLASNVMHRVSVVFDWTNGRMTIVR